MERLFEKNGGKIVSVVLFGSMAKETYTIHSDYDLLIVVSEERLDLKDRFYEYSKYSDGWVEAFVYTVEEVREMFRDKNTLILEALKDGVTLYDKGFWENLRKEFEELLRCGIVTPKKDGWIINRKSNP